jgi:hypothetical protein
LGVPDNFFRRSVTFACDTTWTSTQRLEVSLDANNTPTYIVPGQGEVNIAPVKGVDFFRGPYYLNFPAAGLNVTITEFD